MSEKNKKNNEEAKAKEAEEAKAKEAEEAKAKEAEETKAKEAEEAKAKEAEETKAKEAEETKAKEAEEAKAKEAEEAKAKEAEEAKALAAERDKIQAVKYENVSSTGEAEIVVIHEKANRLSLPYKDTDGKGGMRMCVLNPGKNHVGIKVWNAVKDMQGEEDWAHLSRHFNVKAIEGSERGSVSDLETPDFLDIIENTYSIPELENYEALEKNKKTGEVRKGILTAIKKQMKEVKDTKEDIEKKKEKK